MIRAVEDNRCGRGRIGISGLFCPNENKFFLNFPLFRFMLGALSR